MDRLAKETLDQGIGPLKVSINRFETTDQLLHLAVASNQVGCSCTWQISLSRDTNTGAMEEIPALKQIWIGCNHPTLNWSYQDKQVPYFVRGPPTVCHHCGQTLTIDHMLLECAVLQECRDEYYTVDSLNTLSETIPETCIVEILQEAGLFNLMWCNLLT